jgi:hypothetical protein
VLLSPEAVASSATSGADPASRSACTVLASAATRQPLGFHVQEKAGVAHSSGLAAHIPLPSESKHQPHPLTGVQVVHEVNAWHPSP